VGKRKKGVKEEINGHVPVSHSNYALQKLSSVKRAHHSPDLETRSSPVIILSRLSHSLDIFVTDDGFCRFLSTPPQVSYPVLNSAMIVCFFLFSFLSSSFILRFQSEP